MDEEPQARALMAGALLWYALTEANGGREPRTVWQCRRVARRFGVKIKFRDAAPSLFRRGRFDGGTIYIRRTHDMARLRLALVHELGEAATYWDGVPPLVCSAGRHEAACAMVAMF